MQPMQAMQQHIKQHMRQPTTRIKHSVTLASSIKHMQAITNLKPTSNRLMPTTNCQPQGMLRTKEVMERLKSVTTQPGQKPPILIYLGVLLQKGKLNVMESTELARWVLFRVYLRGIFVWMRDLLNNSFRRAQSWPGGCWPLSAQEGLLRHKADQDN